MTWQEIVFGILAAVGATAIPYLFKLLRNLANRSKWLAKTAIDDLAFNHIQQIIMSVTGPLAEEFKAKNADGKLTENEKKELQATALDLLKKHGKERGINFLKECGPEVLKAVIDKVVEWVKRSKN